MANKDMFNMIKSNFKRLYPNATTDQFINYLRTKHKEIYKFAERNGFLKQLPASTTDTKVTTKDVGKKPPVSTQQQQPKVNSVGQKQITGSSPKLLTGGTNPTDNEINKLYTGREKTINPNDILGKGAKATSKEGLLGKFGQIGQKAINNPVVKGAGKVAGKLAIPAAIGYGLYDAGITAANWNAAGSSPTSRFFDAIGNHEQAQIRREADAPYGSYISNSVKEPTEAERTQIVNKYNAEQPQINTPEENALKMDLYGTTNVTGNSVPVDSEGILDTHTGSTGGAVDGDGAGAPPSQSLTEISDSGNINNNGGGIVGGIPVSGSAAQAAPVSGYESPYSQAQFYADSRYALGLPVEASPETQQAMNNLNTGYVSQRDMYDRLNQAQRGYLDVIAAQNDPRYQGGLIPASGYDVNQARLQDAQSVDRVAQLYNTMYGENNQIGAVQNELNNARVNYEVGIARQAGVPYEDYKQAMLERRLLDIEANKQAVQDQLKFQAQQTNDYAQKRQLAQEMYKADLSAAQAKQKALLDINKDLRVAAINNQGRLEEANIQGQYGNQRANIQGQYDIGQARIKAESDRQIAELNNAFQAAQQAQKLNDPIAYTNAMAGVMNSFTNMYPQMQEGIIATNPVVREMIFGKGVSPEQALEALRGYQAAGGKNTGFNLFDWIRGRNAQQ